MTTTANRELIRETWGEYFEALSRELLNAPVAVGVAVPGGELRPQAEAALQSLVYDRRGDVFEVSVATGGPHLPSVTRHLVEHPRRVVVDSETMLAPMSIRVDAGDGSRTLIAVRREGVITS